MGLRIWLPLNGDLENKGLDNIVIANNGATIDDNGKIGKCYSFDGTNDYINITNANYPNIFAGSFSICFWVYSNTDGSRDVYFGNYGLSGSGNWFNIEKNTNNELRFWWNNGSPNKYFTSYNILNSEGWTHIALTRFENTVKVYKNGTLIESYTVTLSNNVPTTATMFVIGGDSRHSGDLMLGGRMNDFRLYDECLSPMQIKLISQGLVAHYLLNNNNGGMPNLLKGVPKFYSRTGYNPYQLDIINNLEVGKTYTVQFWNVDVSHTGKTANDLGISVYWGGGNISLVHFRGTNFFTNGHADYLTGTFTITSDLASKSGATNAWLNIYNSVPSADGTKSLTIGHWKLEENSAPTPWSPYADDTTNIEYDVSGYCHNGIKHNITEYTSDSPRYSLATKFNGTNSYINVGRGGMVKDEITINLWGYMDDWTKYNSRLISCTEGGGWNFEPSNEKIHFAIGTGTTSNAYKSTSGYSLSELSSGWHMFTGIYDGLTVKQYVDGVFNTSYNAYTTKTPIHYHGNNSILIGAEASNNSTSTGGGYFNGNLSDIRIYATALSDADILSLYNNSAFLDSSGNMYATEYIEE